MSLKSAKCKIMYLDKKYKAQKFGEQELSTTEVEKELWIMIIGNEKNKAS